MSRSVIIAGGGTGGHVNPALAIADAFGAAGGVDLLFIGTAAGLETRLVPERGYRLELVPGSRLVGTGLIGKMRGVWGLVRGVYAARRLIRSHGAQLVVGVGGYASGAALLAARTLGVGTAIHESNAVAGMTNRVLGRLVDRVYVGFEAAVASFPRQRTVVVGNPVRPEIARLAAVGVGADAATAARVCQGRVLVVGGSQGALFLNENVPALLGVVARSGVKLDVRHQVGKLDAAPVIAAYAAAGVDAEVVPYIDDMAAALAWADVAVTRSGSGTVAELAAAGLPALLVPFPHAAGDHQAANAAAFCDGGAGHWCRQSDWNLEKLAPTIVSLLTDNASWSRAHGAALQVARPDAAQRIVDDCVCWMGGRW